MLSTCLAPDECSVKRSYRHYHDHCELNTGTQSGGRPCLCSLPLQMSLPQPPTCPHHHRLPRACLSGCRGMALSGPKEAAFLQLRLPSEGRKEALWQIPRAHVWPPYLRTTSCPACPTATADWPRDSCPIQARPIGFSLRNLDSDPGMWVPPQAPSTL